MQLLRLNEVVTSPQDRVFRYSPVRATLLALGVVGFSAALVLVDWEGRSRSAYYVAYYIAGFLLLCLLLMRRFLVARFLPSNWLVRMRHDALLIQFRSYLNYYHLPAEDFTVILIPYREIRSARLVRERANIQAQGGASVQTRRLIELELSGDLEPVSKALAAELARPAPQQRTWYGTTSTLYEHYPVRMVSSPFLQIEWSVRPSATSFLDVLRPHTTIAPPMMVSEDFAHLGRLSRDEQEKRLRELDQRGRTIAAVYMARRLYGYDLNQAQAFIEGLRPSP